ncbi:MAG: hypothetical protein GH144_00075 [Clostridia bacterium]|jgi:hypothetical protein|nr:hypothetical protein [Clostridia bacterium]
MSREPKYIQLEREILELKLRQYKIVIMTCRRVITQLKDFIKIVDISEKEFGGMKEKFKEQLLFYRSQIERKELDLEWLLNQRQLILLQLQWLEKPKRRIKGGKKE